MKRPFGPLRAGWLAALLVVMTGCSSLTEEEPPVQDSLLVEVLVDLHLAEARQESGAPPLSVPRDSLLARHGLDPVAYRAAMAYYAERPEAFYDLYDAVLERLHAEARDATTAPSDP